MHLSPVEIGAIFGLLVIGVPIFIWMLVDCVTKEPSEGNDRIVWTLVIVLAGWPGALIYLFVRRPKRKALLGR